MTAQPCVRFNPSRVEGLPDASEVAVFPDRLEVRSRGEWVVFPFEEMIRRDAPKGVNRLGWGRKWLPVADRDWFADNEGKFFAFYTEPRLVIYMPADGPADYEQSHFRRIEGVIHAGGYTTHDLG